MKTLFNRVTSIVMVCVFCVLLCLPASAGTVSEVKHKSTKYGGGSATVFYVNAVNKNTTKLRYTCDKWALVEKDGSSVGFPSQGKAGYFEVLMWGRNSTSENWKVLKTHKVNMKGVTSATLSMSGYTQYKVRVYTWKTSTLGSYLGGKWNSSAYWSDGYAPTCTFRAQSNVRSLAK